MQILSCSRVVNLDEFKLWKCIYRSLLTALFLLGPATPILRAQQNSYLNNIGVPSFTQAIPIENGAINVANGNLHLEIPLQGPFAQRAGGNFNAVIMYDSAIWTRHNGVPTKFWWPSGPGNVGGWRVVTSADKGSANYTNSYVTCYSSTYGNVTTEIDFNNFSWIAADGTQHLFPILVSAGYNPDPADCIAGQTVTSGNAFATDRSGYHMWVTTTGGSQISTVDVYSPEGTHVYGPTSLVTTGPTGPNGNYYSRDGNNNPVDTLGRSPILTTTSGNNTYIDVLDSHGDRHRYTIIWQSIDANTSFAQAATTEYNSTTSGKISVIQEIDLDLTGVFCTSGSEREFTLKESWYAHEEIQAGADRDAAAAD